MITENKFEQTQNQKIYLYFMLFSTRLNWVRQPPKGWPGVPLKLKQRKYILYNPHWTNTITVRFRLTCSFFSQLLDDLSKSYHSISYCASPCLGNNISTNSPAHHSLNSSWQFYNFMGTGQDTDTTCNNVYKKPVCVQAILYRKKVSR